LPLDQPDGENEVSAVEARLLGELQNHRLDFLPLQEGEGGIGGIVLETVDAVAYLVQEIGKIQVPRNPVRPIGEVERLWIRVPEGEGLTLEQDALRLLHEEKLHDVRIGLVFSLCLAAATDEQE